MLILLFSYLRNRILQTIDPVCFVKNELWIQIQEINLTLRA